MFDMKNLGDMAKLAGQAKQLQEAQQKSEQKKIEILSKISATLEEILGEMKKKG